MSSALPHLVEAPPLDERWQAYERTSNPESNPTEITTIETPFERRESYSKACRARNEKMLSDPGARLFTSVYVMDEELAMSDGSSIPIRHYLPGFMRSEREDEDEEKRDSVVIYFHGGGLKVGDLDSEDLSCRRICEDAAVRVVSVGYRLLPEVDCRRVLLDAWEAFLLSVAGIEVWDDDDTFRLILVGSSSGGQLAAQVSQLARTHNSEQKIKAIDGVLLRCPVTIDASNNGSRIPEAFRPFHTSYSSTFSNRLIRFPLQGAEEEMANLPLEAASFENLPRTFIQLCSNDVYYSDGFCYAMALEDAGVEVRTEVLYGWPHTFWLKAPELQRSLEAEEAMIAGLKWLLT